MAAEPAPVDEDAAALAELAQLNSGGGAPPKPWKKKKGKKKKKKDVSLVAGIWVASSKHSSPDIADRAAGTGAPT